METNERLEEELRRGLLLGDILVSLFEPRGFKKVLERLSLAVICDDKSTHPLCIKSDKEEILWWEETASKLWGMKT